MKKILSLILVACMAFACLALSACVWEGMFGTTATTTPSSTTVQKPGGEHYSGEALDEEEAVILNDFLTSSALIGDISPEEIDYTCFGKFGDSIAIYFHSAGAYSSKTSETIAGFRFDYPDSRAIKIWNNGRFYKMAEAFEKGMIAEADIESIHKNASFLIHKEPLFIYEDKEESFLPEIQYTAEFGNAMMHAGIGVKLDPNICKGDRAAKFSADCSFWRGLDIEGVGILEYGDDTLYGVILPMAYYSTIEDYLYRLVYYKTEIEKIDGVTKAWIQFPTKYILQANDTHYVSTSISPSSKLALEQIDVQKVWSFTTGSENVKVGILDTGIASHADLNDNYTFSFDYYMILGDNPIFQKIDNDSHGTHVAGIVGAVGNNGTGTCGVNWDVDLIQMRFINKDFTVLDYNEKAVKWAVNNWDTEHQIRIINYSVGNTSPDSSFKDIIAQYTDKGGLFVCAAGNDAKDIDDAADTQYPAFYGKDTLLDTIDNIIVVGALDYYNQRAGFSNWGENTVDVYAPGISILSTTPIEQCTEGSNRVMTQWGEFYKCECVYKLHIDYDAATTDGFQWVPTGSGHVSNGYHYMSGTSMATPFVTGVAALLLSVDSDLTATQIKECILEGAEEITISIPDGTTQQVKSLNAWGSFKYLMNNYPALEQEVSTNLTQCSYNVNSSSTYFYDNTAMIKLVVPCDGNYTFSVSSSNAIDVILYNYDLDTVSTSQTEHNSGSQIVFPNTLEKGTYYLRADYSDGTSSGTINVSINCNAHEHNYDRWSYYDSTLHAKACICGHKSTQYAAHAIKLSEVFGNRALCHLCGAMIILDDGFGQIIHNVQKVSINGSYILPSGVVVLVDEDVEAYENGTLVFYDKNNLPETQ